MPESSFPSKPFSGVRFVLLGFDPIYERQVRSKLVDGGGVDVGQYSENCTHVIVDKILYDDPLCVAFRDDDKTLVTGLWVDHSYDIGMPVDATSIMYRPLKDLNGIPGAKSLVVCLTGYQRQDRDDIMTMVGLMGAQFTKPLVANKVTHLICYKFEGEKYELAKKMKRIKLVNHRWLEDCLRNWVILPESNFIQSGYELEMEAEAKDSEEEAEDTYAKQFREKSMNKSPPDMKVGTPKACEFPISIGEKIEILPDPYAPKGSLDVVNAKGLLLEPRKENKSDQALSLDDVGAPGLLGSQDGHALRNATHGEPPTLYERTPVSIKVGNNLESSSRSAEKSPLSDAELSLRSYSRKNSKRPTLQFYSGEAASNLNDYPKVQLGEFKVNDVSDISFSEKELVRDRNVSGWGETLQKGKELLEEEMSGKSPQKRKITDSCASFKSQKTNHEAIYCFTRSPLANEKTQGLEQESSLDNPLKINKDPSVGIEMNRMDETWKDEKEDKKTPQTSVGRRRKPVSSSKHDVEHIGKEKFSNMIGETGHPQIQQQDVDNSSLCKKKTSEIETSHGPDDLDLLDGGNGNLIMKPLKKKVVASKTLGSRPKLSNTRSRKGSIYVNNTASRNDATVSLCGEKEIAGHENNPSSNKHEISSPSTVSVQVMKEAMSKNNTKSRDDFENKPETMDDDTEAPEDRDEHESGKANNEDKFPVVELTHKADRIMKEKSDVIHHQHMPNIFEATIHDAMAPEEDKNQNAMTKAACSKNIELSEPTCDRDDAKEKLKKRKRCPIGKTDQETLPGALEILECRKDIKKTKEKGVKNKALQFGGKTKKSSVPANKLEKSLEPEKENKPAVEGDQNASQSRQNVGNSAVKSNKIAKKINKKAGKSSPSSVVAGEVLNIVKTEPLWFILSGHKLQRKEFQKVIRSLKGKFCRDSHHWSYQATHFIAPDPIRRTEKFFAAAASGRWILKTDYITACGQAGKFIAEEPYEWHNNGLSEDGAINLEAPRKWRLLRERTGHGAFYGMRIIVYGECIVPPLDTLKRVVKAGDGTILATSPPYTRFLNSGIDFAIITPGMPSVDLWVQEFLKHDIPCVVADYLVEYVCKPGYSLEKHVLYNTHAWAEKSFANIQRRAEEIVDELTVTDAGGSSDIMCQVCGSSDREEVMLICSNESGSVGCGVGIHIDCCDPPLEEIPEDDWFCPKCCRSGNSSNAPLGKKNECSEKKSTKKKNLSSRRM